MPREQDQMLSLPDEQQGAAVHCRRSGDFVYLVAGETGLSTDTAAAFLEDLRQAWLGFLREGEEKAEQRNSLLSQDTAFSTVLRHLMVGDQTDGA